jgi:hypothetical protein
MAYAVSMRSFDGQRSDRQPVKRTPAEKEKQLQVLKERLADMKAHESPALRESIRQKIKELEEELGKGR